MAQAQAIHPNDYSLVGRDTITAIHRGLAQATWYSCLVPRDKMRELLERKNSPAVRDTLLWFGLMLAAGGAGCLLWRAGSWWAAVPFMIYGALYASTSDSRWHEAGHGTAFKTDWMNNALYEIASFMVMRESVIWRWSHTRHHSDTLVVGRDPEIAVMRPPALRRLILNFFGLPGILAYFRQVILHCTGRLTAEERTFVPESEQDGVIIRARIYLLIYAAVLGLALWTQSLLALMYIGLPTLYGSWLMPIYGYTQHSGLAENVLDHRLNCRTVYMNTVNRFLYWNMNYHIEHHMFPLVPYHNLPRLHELVRADMPTPYPSIWAAWRELAPAVLRQARNPAYFVERKLPESSRLTGSPPATHVFTAKGRACNGWLEVCASAFLKPAEVIRLDHEQKTYAIYRAADGALYCTDGLCTHGNAQLAEGLIQGCLIECPKHNGRFDFTNGSPQRRPACVPLKTYPANEHDGKVFVNLTPAPSGAAESF